MPVEAIKLGGDTLVEAITASFNKCLELENIPQAWENAPITLLKIINRLNKLDLDPVSVPSTNEKCNEYKIPIRQFAQMIYLPYNL